MTGKSSNNLSTDKEGKQYSRHLTRQTKNTDTRAARRLIPQAHVDLTIETSWQLTMVTRPQECDVGWRRFQNRTHLAPQFRNDTVIALVNH